MAALPSEPEARRIASAGNVAALRRGERRALEPRSHCYRRGGSSRHATSASFHRITAWLPCPEAWIIGKQSSECIDDQGVFDLGGLAERLLLFERVTVRSNRLTEIPVLARAFGVKGLTTVLNQGALRFDCNTYGIGNFNPGGQPRPFSYEIKAFHAEGQGEKAAGYLNAALNDSSKRGLRWVATCGAGLVGAGLGGGVAGAAASALDAFLVERVFPYSGPIAFLNKSVRSILKG